jgi:Ca2+/Na+ antiporter
VPILVKVLYIVEIFRILIVDIAFGSLELLVSSDLFIFLAESISWNCSHRCNF